MVVFDITIAIVIIFFIINSLMRGMIKEVFALIAYVMGFITAHRFNDITMVYLKDYAGGPTGGKILGFFLVLIVVSLLVKLLGRWIQQVMYSNGELSFLDRTFGAILGFAKGIFIIAIIMIPMELFPDFYKKVTADSLIAPYLKKTSGYLRQYLFSNENLNINSDDFDIDSSIFNYKQIRKLKKKLAPHKEITTLKDSPQDDYSDASRQELEKLLKDIQDQ